MSFFLATGYFENTVYYQTGVLLIMNKVSFLPKVAITAFSPQEFIKRENTFTPNWANPKVNRFGYLDNSYTKMFGFPERGGSRAGELMHQIEGRRVQLWGPKFRQHWDEGVGLVGDLKKTFGSVKGVERYRTLWKSQNAVQAIKEFPGILESSTSYGSRPIVDRALSFLPRAGKFLSAGARFAGPVGLAMGAYDFMDNVGGLPWTKNKPQRNPLDMSQAEKTLRTGPQPQFNSFK